MKKSEFEQARHRHHVEGPASLKGPRGEFFYAQAVEADVAAAEAAGVTWGPEDEPAQQQASEPVKLPQRLALDERGFIQPEERKLAGLPLWGSEEQREVGHLEAARRYNEWPALVATLAHARQLRQAAEVGERQALQERRDIEEELAACQARVKELEEEKRTHLGVDVAKLSEMELKLLAREVFGYMPWELRAELCEECRSERVKELEDELEDAKTGIRRWRQLHEQGSEQVDALRKAREEDRRTIAALTGAILAADATTKGGGE